MFVASDHKFWFCSDPNNFCCRRKNSCIMSADSESRKRLRPWLEAKINSGTIPGLYWLNEEKNMFRIPWKHAGKQDWTPDQSLLFMVSVSVTFDLCYLTSHQNDFEMTAKVENLEVHHPCCFGDLGGKQHRIWIPLTGFICFRSGRSIQGGTGKEWTIAITLRGKRDWDARSTKPKTFRK